MGNAEMDQHLLAACDTRWLKVAKIVWEASQTSGLGEKEWGADALAKRVRALVKKRRLEAVGNLRDWRASEVRLRQIS
jgi:hypothetical protein